jgi:hypothetical protein
MGETTINLDYVIQIVEKTDSTLGRVLKFDLFNDSVHSPDFTLYERDNAQLFTDVKKFLRDVSIFP